MRTYERYIKRVAIPVIAAGVLITAGNILFRAFTADESDAAAKNVPARETPGQTTSNFSEATVQAEITALEETVTKLDQALEERNNDADTNQRSDAIGDQREKVAESLAALDEANKENWLALRNDAYDQVQAYAEIIGQEIDPARKASVSR